MSGFLRETKEQRAAARRHRLQTTRDRQIATALEYYATTSVPVERIVAHLALDEVRVRSGLRYFGRAA